MHRVRFSCSGICARDLVQHPVLSKEQCPCFSMTCLELGINLDGVSVVLLSKLGKCHFRQAKLSPRVQNFSIMTENRSKLGLQLRDAVPPYTVVCRLMS